MSAECDLRAWFTCGTHGCKRGQGRTLGLHNHRCWRGRHFYCSYCGSRWVRPL
jgi:hypothetical protein